MPESPKQTVTSAVREGYYGLKNCHVAFMKPDGSYEAPMKVPGIIALKVKASTSSEQTHADDIVWATVNVNNGFTADAQFIAVPDAIKAKMLGYEVDSNGALLGVTDGTPTHFALMAEEQSITGNPRARVYYDCTLSVPDSDMQTKADKPDIKSESYSLTSVPAIIGNKTMAHAELQRSESNKAVYAEFFEKVYEPNATA